MTNEVSSFNNPIQAKHWLLNILLFVVLSFSIWGLIPIVFLLVYWGCGYGGVSEAKRGYIIATALMSLTAVAFIIVFSIILVFMIGGPIY